MRGGPDDGRPIPTARADERCANVGEYEPGPGALSAAPLAPARAWACDGTPIEVARAVGLWIAVGEYDPGPGDAEAAR